MHAPDDKDLFLPRAQQAAQRFAGGRPLSLQRIGAGLINDSFLVILQTDGGQRRAVLQRINGAVFRHPPQVMANMEKVLAHFARLRAAGADTLDMPTLYHADDGLPYVRDDAGDIWRLMSYLEHTSGLQRLSEPQQARAIGSALGRFHRAMTSLDAAGLYDTLPGFHVTPAYLASYDAGPQVAAAAGEDEHFCAAMIEDGRAQAGVLQRALTAGELPPRVMHGDPKVNNFLFSTDHSRAVSLIDLDTVKPGLFHYDIADCIRSACNPAGEDAGGEPPALRMDFCRALLSGYLQAVGALLNGNELRYLAPAIVLMPYELGLRFFQDHLQGDRYFKVKFRGHNLQRAQNQLRLWRNMQQHADELQALILSLTALEAVDG